MSVPPVAAQQPAESTATAPIRVRVRTLSQLFNSMDPSPFRERDLDPQAETFIVDWARELIPRHGAHRPLTIRIELTGEEVPDDGPALVRDALATFFTHAARHEGARLRRLLRDGRLSLAIGLGFLAACGSLSAAVSGAADGTLALLASEGLLIGGWVAMWRPMEIFLYDWWPLARELRLYRRLAGARVELVGPAVSPGAR